MTEIERLSNKAAYYALVRLGHPDVSKADTEDMAQEAAVVFWRNQDKGENYAFVCARRAALNWYIRFVLDWRRKDTPPKPTPQSTVWALSERDMEELPAPEEEEPMDLDSLPDIHGELMKIFENARDVLIVEMVLQGHTNEGIAQELDLSPASVKRYRSEIRRKLKEEAEKDD